MFNHKGFTLIETLVSMLLMTSFMILFVTYLGQMHQVQKQNQNETIGMYLAEHVQSMMLLNVYPFDDDEVNVLMDTYGDIDSTGTYEVFLSDGYVIIIDLESSDVIYEGVIG